jgi:hypothetical protein
MHTKPNSHERIPNQSREYRKARGLTQRKVTRILGFANFSSVSPGGTGRLPATMRNMFRLAANNTSLL